MYYQGPVLPVGARSDSTPGGDTPEAPIASVVVRIGAPPPGGPFGRCFILVKLLCVVDDPFVPGLKFRGEVRNIGPNPAGTSREAFTVSVHKVKANPILRRVKINPVSTFCALLLVLGFEDGGFSMISALAAGLLHVVGGVLGLVPVQQKATLTSLSHVSKDAMLNECRL